MRARFLFLVLGLIAALSLSGCPDSEDAGTGGATDTVADAPDGAGICIPACDWRECGVEPACTTSCGACTTGTICDKGSCIPPGCVPDCSQVACGPDPICGAYCGGCGAGLTCSDGACVEGTCEQQCGRRECGPDPVCFESCGLCQDGWHCQDGTCVEGACVPNCGELECGVDSRCGVSCGECTERQMCVNGLCVDEQPNCCEAAECGPSPQVGCEDVDCGTCAAGFECRQRRCQPPVTCDPPCGDGWACVNGRCECVPDCDGRQCGTDGCGGVCGACDPACDCVGGLCLGCDQPCCGERTCGPDPCGTDVVCGTCEPGCACGADGQCLCGLEGACANDHDLNILNGVDATALVTQCLLNLECPEPECYANCIQGETGISGECAGCYGTLSACGLRSCAPRCLADQGGPDCIACLESFCLSDFERCAGIELLPCTPQCAGLECGPDPQCGASCGTCEAGLRCDAGVCTDGPCEPQCDNRECGLDPACGRSCGFCPPGEFCANGACEPGPCEPQCANLECGPDPVCGRPCGFCGPGSYCERGQCVEGPCEPLCGDRECGPDPVCGLSCGFCGAGERCVQGACEPFQPPEDACANTRDLALLNDIDAMAVAQTCVFAAGCALDDTACFARCVREQTGLSQGCSACFGALAVCGVANCAGACLDDPGGAACMGCLADACIPDFEQCAGVTWNPECTPDCDGLSCGPDPVCGQSCGTCGMGAACVDGRCEPIGPPPDDACNNPDDLALLNQLDAVAIAEQCLLSAGCGVDEACITACISQETGVSDGCAECYGSLSICGLNNCLVACFDDPGGAACLGCLEDRCLPAFETCSGVTWEGGGTCTPRCEGRTCGDDGCGGSCGTCAADAVCRDGQCIQQPQAACADPENLAILATLDFASMATTCLPQCFSDIACLTGCIEQDTGLGRDCASCMAGTAACAIQFCLNACIADPGSPACGACVIDSCGADFESCSGVELPPIAF